eukprot:gene35424-41801_t
MDGDILTGLPAQFELKVTATDPDGVIMALQHISLPIAAVQFHPESILTLPKHGMQIINNALTMLSSERFPEKET